MKFSELIRLLEGNGFKLVKGRAPYGTMPDLDGIAWSGSIITGTKEVPAGTCYAVRKAAGIDTRKR